jgi:hypothetical protein
MQKEHRMQTEPTPKDESKDEFFERLAKLSEEMVAKHGKDFSMGALVLAARWIAENRVGQLKTLEKPKLRRSFRRIRRTGFALRWLCMPFLQIATYPGRGSPRRDSIQRSQMQQVPPYSRCAGDRRRYQLRRSH